MRWFLRQRKRLLFQGRSAGSSDILKAWGLGFRAYFLLLLYGHYTKTYREPLIYQAFGPKRYTISANPCSGSVLSPRISGLEPRVFGLGGLTRSTEVEANRYSGF